MPQRDECDGRAADRASLIEVEDRELLRIVRSIGRQDAVRFRWALIVRASARGIAAPVIATVLDADADHVRDVIHAFNADGLTALDPHWGPGPPPRTTPAEETDSRLGGRRLAPGRPAPRPAHRRR